MASKKTPPTRRLVVQARCNPQAVHGDFTKWAAEFVLVVVVCSHKFWGAQQAHPIGVPRSQETTLLLGPSQDPTHGPTVGS